MKRGGGERTSTSRDETRRQLDAAYAALEELDEDLRAGRLSAADHAQLRTKTESQAARLVSTLRDGTGAQTATLAAPSNASGRSRLMSPVGLGCVAALIFLAGTGVGFTLGRSVSTVAGGATSAVARVALPATGGRAAEPPAEIPSHPTAVAPAQPAAPGGPGTAGGAGVRVSAKLEALAGEIQSDSAPTKTLLAFGHAALEEGQRPAAIWAYKRVLAREPKNPDAATGIAAILAEGGFVDQALMRIDDALSVSPRHPAAHWLKARILFAAKQDYPASIAEAETFLKLAPSGAEAERARAMIGEARRRAAAPVPPPSPAATPAAQPRTPGS